MDYFTLKGSCLLTIMIPLNFAIGDGIKWKMEKGKTAWLYILSHLLVGIIVTLITIINSKDNYYIPFIYMGGIVLAIIQNIFIFRKTEKDLVDYNYLEIIIKKINIIIGIILIFLPYFSFFKSFLLEGCEKKVYLFCYFIYLYWGIEKVILNVKDLYMYKKALKCDEF